MSYKFWHLIWPHLMALNNILLAGIAISPTLFMYREWINTVRCREYYINKRQKAARPHSGLDNNL